MNPRQRLCAAGSALVALTLICGGAAATPASCDRRLVIGLTPDVPDPRSAGFLSSLLGNHPEYTLALRGQREGSVIVVDLIGPHQGYSCDDVVQAIRKDGRVLYVHLHEGEP